jgi:hypothetical protein
MELRSKGLFCGLLVTVSVISYAQPLYKARLSSEDVKDGVLLKYHVVSEFDGGVVLRLYKNKQYRYDVETSNYQGFGMGIWTSSDSEFVLNSFLQKENVPIKITYLDSVSASERIHKIGMQIPVNLNGERLPDSRIFLNDDSIYAFPYFDTVVGSPIRVSRIRVDFGDGYTSRWTPIAPMAGKQLLIIAQIDFIPASYIVFKNERFRKTPKSLTIVEQ